MDERLPDAFERHIGKPFESVDLDANLLQLDGVTPEILESLCGDLRWAVSTIYTEPEGQLEGAKYVMEMEAKPHQKHIGDRWTRRRLISLVEASYIDFPLI